MNLKPISEYQKLADLKGHKTLPSLFAKSNTLILIKKNYTAAYACNVGDKRALIDNYFEEQGDALILVWGGQWSSDAFQIDSEDIKNLIMKQ